MSSKFHSSAHVGEDVSVFSRSADSWLDGRITKILNVNRVFVEYDHGGKHFGKALCIYSKQVRTSRDEPRYDQSGHPEGFFATRKFQWQFHLDFEDCLVDGCQVQFTSEEILIIDAKQDAALRDFMAFLGGFIKSLGSCSMICCTQIAAELVSLALGGHESERHLVSRCRKRFDAAKGCLRIGDLLWQKQGNYIPGVGLRRHRAVLMKYVCDSLGFAQCALSSDAVFVRLQLGVDASIPDFNEDLIGSGLSEACEASWSDLAMSLQVDCRWRNANIDLKTLVRIESGIFLVDWHTSGHLRKNTKRQKRRKTTGDSSEDASSSSESACSRPEQDMLGNEDEEVQEQCMAGADQHKRECEEELCLTEVPEDAGEGQRRRNLSQGDSSYSGRSAHSSHVNRVSFGCNQVRQNSGEQSKEREYETSCGKDTVHEDLPHGESDRAGDECSVQNDHDKINNSSLDSPTVQVPNCEWQMQAAAEKERPLAWPTKYEEPYRLLPVAEIVIDFAQRFRCVLMFRPFSVLWPSLMSFALRFADILSLDMPMLLAWMGLPRDIYRWIPSILPWTILVSVILWIQVHRRQWLCKHRFSWDNVFWFRWNTSCKVWIAFCFIPLIIIVALNWALCGQLLAHWMLTPMIFWCLMHGGFFSVVTFERSRTRRCIDIDGPTMGMKIFHFEAEMAMVRVAIAVCVALYLSLVRTVLESICERRPWSTLLAMIPTLLPLPIALVWLSMQSYPPWHRALFGHLKPKCESFRLFSLFERAAILMVMTFTLPDSMVQRLVVGILYVFSAVLTSYLRPYVAMRHTVLQITMRWSLVVIWMATFLGHLGPHAAMDLQYLFLGVLPISSSLLAIVFACSCSKLHLQWQDYQYQAELARRARKWSSDEIEVLACSRDISPIEVAWGWSMSQRAALLRNRQLKLLLCRNRSLGCALVAAHETIRPGSSLVDAIQLGCTDVEILGALLECKAAPNAMDVKGQTPLHCACEEGLLEICQLLIMSGANTNVRNRGNGSRPLHCVAKSGNLEICRLLIDNQACVNVNSCGSFRSPLSYACAGGHASVIALLQEHEVRDFSSRFSIMGAVFSTSQRKQISLTAAADEPDTDMEHAAPTADLI